MSRRKHISLKTKLASALLTIVRPDEAGVMRPVISFERAKTMTAEQIIGQFHFDHVRFATWGGPDEPWNLQPLPVAEHVAKTKRDVKAISKVRRAEKKKADKKRRARAIPSRPFPSASQRKAWRAERGL